MNTSLEDLSVTPPTKKLKQGRLPFRIISESPESPSLRKRKLSNDDNEKVSKIGKLCEPVEISDSEVVVVSSELPTKQENTKRKAEREREKLEREKKRQKEKEEKQRLKQEKDDQRKKEREEKEEQKRKEKEDKERQKEIEKKLKEEKEEKKRKEKEEKEEQRKKEKEAKEEEKRKKQEALEQEKQDLELKKKKAAKAFVNFFVSKQKVETDQVVAPVSQNNLLSSFAIKADMRLAPTVRVQFDPESQNGLDKAMEAQTCLKSDLYLNRIKEGSLKPKSTGKTWPFHDKNDDDDDVIIVEDELPPLVGSGEVVMPESAVREKLRPKLLSFHENRRPPYWGTWRKKSTFVTPRRPLGQDQKQLDYEVDSEEEWEEEEGESIGGSVAGSDDEPHEADEYEVDNEFFVPHGYLSDEEATMDEDDVLSLSPETQKARLKHLEDEFESEMKKPTEKLKTRLYGLLWESSNREKPEHCVEALWNYFSKMSMIMNDPSSLLQPSNDTEEPEKKKRKKKITKGDESNLKAKKMKLKSDIGEIRKSEVKINTPDSKKNQPGINTFLKKIASIN